MSRTRPVVRTAAQLYPDNYSAAVARRNASTADYYRNAFPRGKQAPAKAMTPYSRSYSTPAKKELHYWDRTYDEYAIEPLGAYIDQYMFLPQIGAGLTNRIGRKATIKSIAVNMHLYNIASSGAWSIEAERASDIYRIVLVMDREPGGAVPALTDIFEPSPPSTASNIDSHLEKNNAGRFSVIKEWRGELQNPQITFTEKVASEFYVIKGSSVTQIKDYITCNIPVDFRASTGTYGDALRNNFLLLGWCVNEPQLYVHGQVRFRFEE